MKALSLWQPWASLVALGGKRVETRSWRTHYRGPLLIHATARSRRDILSGTFVEEAAQVLGVADFAPLPRSAVLAIADLVDCVQIGVGSVGCPACAAWAPHETRCAKREHLFGDYTPGRWAWVLRNVRPVRDPILCPGGQRLWTPPPDVLLLTLQRT